MSQAKVDKYKEEKKNRKKIMAKEKMQRRLTQAALAIVGVVIVAWIGISIYQVSVVPSEEEPVQAKEYTLDSSALDDYISSLTED